MKKIIPRAEKIIGKYENYTLPELIKFLEARIAALPKKQRADVSFSIDTESYSYDDGEYPGLFINYQSPETDVEEAKRETFEKAQQARQEERDRADFKRLSEKFKAK